MQYIGRVGRGIGHGKEWKNLQKISKNVFKEKNVYIESDLTHFVSFLQVRVNPNSVLQIFAQSFTLSDILEK